MLLGWVVLQVADVIVPALALPDWTITFLLVVGIFGFPFALFFAWAYELTPDGMAILGICEVENRRVLEDFVKQPAVVERNYQIVHYDSPDERGIDVALIYQPKYFKVTDSKPIPLIIYDDDGDRIEKRVHRIWSSHSG